MSNIQLVQDAPRQQRVMRQPKHTHQVRHRPWQIQPFMIAPVLPGETLQNMLFQSRVVTDPLQNGLIGWWIEYYWFYVKHRDLDDRDLLVDMMLVPGTDVSSLHTAAQVETYHYAASIDWTQKCLKRITEEYFREEGEAWNATLIGNLPVAAINQDSLVDSIVDETLIPEGADPQTTADNMETMDRYMRQYLLMSQMGLANMTYEDYLRTFGVKIPDSIEAHRPELIRYAKDWTYPSNTIDPVTGAPSGACSWAITERADKARVFREPGFIVGVTVARPKVYLANQRGAGAHVMDDAYSWLPALLADDPRTSLKAFTNANGPITGGTNGYWLDVRDLLVHGDQFVNFAMSATDDNSVAMPTATYRKRLPTATDADSMFKNASPQNQIRQDGVTALSILGTQVDQT